MTEGNEAVTDRPGQSSWKSKFPAVAAVLALLGVAAFACTQQSIDWWGILRSFWVWQSAFFYLLIPTLLAAMRLRQSKQRSAAWGVLIAEVFFVAAHVYDQVIYYREFASQFVVTTLADRLVVLSNDLVMMATVYLLFFQVKLSRKGTILQGTTVACAFVWPTANFAVRYIPFGAIRDTCLVLVYTSIPVGVICGAIVIALMYPRRIPIAPTIQPSPIEPG